MSKRSFRKPTDESTELLRDMLIVQLGLAEVTQGNIRKIAKCKINRVNAIVKLLEPRHDKKGRSD